MGLTGQLRNKEPTCRGREFHPWVGKDPLEGEVATGSSILAWEILGQRSLAGYSPWGHRESDTTERLDNRSVGLLSFLVFVILITTSK